MIRNILNYILVLILICSFTGCEDFLEEQSQDEVIPKTARDLSELLLGSGYPWGNDNIYPYLFAMSDNVTANTAILSLGEQQPVKDLEAVYTWQPDMAAKVDNVPVGLSESSNTYTTSYIRIMGCNAVIDLIDEARGDVELIERTKAEAHAVRAWHYFNLVNLYGEPYNVNKQALAVPLKTTVDVEDGGIARATVEEVYKLIVDDLKLAVSLFDKYSINRADYRINLPATCILLSRVYLYMEDWSNCEQMASKAIENGQSLDNLSMESGPKVTLSYNSPEVEWLFGKPEYFSIINYGGFFEPSEELLALYDKDNDGRYKTSFSEQTAYIYEDEEYSWKRTPYPFTLVLKHKPSEVGMAIRLAEAYLNRAEAYFKLGDTKAKDDYNFLRERRIKNNIKVSTVTLQNIWDERRRELCFESPRWFDLRRQGMPVIKHKHKIARGTEVYEYTLKENDPMYTLPIPEGVFSNNSLLTQNTSRNGAARAGVLLND